MKTIYFESLPSTNLYLKENYQSLANLTCICANHQTSGRGRLGRTWIDNDDLLFSILIKNENNNLNNPTFYSFIIAATCYKVLKEYGLNALIKWPNDLIVNDKKIAGILLEGVSKDKLECVVLGVGINTNSSNFDDDLVFKATSIKNELKKEVNKKDLLEAILKQFEKDYDLYNENNNTNHFLEIIKSNFYLKNKVCKFNYQNKEYIGKVIDIDEQGFLIVEVNGITMKLNSGEVSLHNNYINFNNLNIDK